jgi:hypothetical protein
VGRVLDEFEQVIRVPRNILVLSKRPRDVMDESESEGSQTHQRVKYDHEFGGTRNQESLCWRGPAAI